MKKKITGKTKLKGKVTKICAKTAGNSPSRKVNDVTREFTLPTPLFILLLQGIYSLSQKKHWLIKTACC